MKSIVLTGGGTMGHVMPHMAIYPYIKEKFDRIYYIGSKNGLEKSFMTGRFDYFEVETAKLSRSFTKENLFILPKLISGITKSTALLKNLKPNVVFSKGGYVAVPVVLAAQRLKIPVVTHESDYTLGLSNKLIAKRCDYVLTSFSNCGANLKNNIYTGPPVRSFDINRQKGLCYFGFTGQKPILLIIGGSLGSLTINRAITDLLPDLLQTYDVLHICGKQNIKKNIKGYYCVNYLNDISLAYSVADIAVSRAGAGVCFELMSLSIPTLFIPLSKKASRGDQIENAAYFFKQGMCNVLCEESLSRRNLKNQIDKTYNERFYYIANMKKADYKNGSLKIASILLKYAR